MSTATNHTVPHDIHHTTRQYVDRYCGRCYKAAAARCTKCQSVYYCSKECQAKDWTVGGHKVRCKQLRIQNEQKLPSSSSSSSSSTSGKQVNGHHNDTDTVNNKSSSSTSLSLKKLPLPTKWLYNPQELASLYNKQPTAIRYGLMNPATTCYINCVLQSLLHTIPFQTYLLSGQHSESENCCKYESSSPSDIRSMNSNKFCALCILEQLALTASCANKSYLPRELLLSLQEINSDYSVQVQEDSAEFLRSLFRCIQASLLSTIPKSDRNTLSVVRTQETSLLYQLFGGYLMSLLTCPKCGHAQSSYESFLDLSLEILEATDTLAEMLEVFTSPERLTRENTWKCETCETSVKATKRLLISQAPNVLILQLKRFRNHSLFGKNNKYIRFNETIDLTPYMSHPSTCPDSVTPAKYALYSVIVHYDMLNSSSFGHYVSYCKDAESNTWWRYDDENVSEVTLEEVLQQKAYVLLYQRISPYIASSDIDTSAHVDDDASKPAMCMDGCGFYASAAYEGRCSLCYKKAQNIDSVPAPASTSSSSLPNTSTLFSGFQHPNALFQRLRMMQAMKHMQHMLGVSQTQHSEAGIDAEQTETNADADAEADSEATTRAQSEGNAYGGDTDATVEVTEEQKDPHFDGAKEQGMQQFFVPSRYFQPSNIHHSIDIHDPQQNTHEPPSNHIIPINTNGAKDGGSGRIAPADIIGDEMDKVGGVSGITNGIEKQELNVANIKIHESDEILSEFVAPTVSLDSKNTKTSQQQAATAAGQEKESSTMLKPTQPKPTPSSNANGAMKNDWAKRGAAPATSTSSTFVNAKVSTKIGVNSQCPCGSKLKFKKCHGSKALS